MYDLSHYTKENIIRDKTSVEAGYVNDPNDRGGETNFGITRGLALRYQTQLIEKFGWNGQMRDLPKPAAYWLYEQEFWAPLLLDQVLQRHPLIADKLFDVGINAGGRTAATHLQIALNVNNKVQTLYPDVVVDGKMGPSVLAALDAFIAKRGPEGIERLLVLLLVQQGSHYINISLSRPANENFTYGWAGRVSRDIGIYSKLLDFERL